MVGNIRVPFKQTIFHRSIACDPLHAQGRPLLAFCTLGNSSDCRFRGHTGRTYGVQNSRAFVCTTQLHFLRVCFHMATTRALFRDLRIHAMSSTPLSYVAENAPAAGPPRCRAPSSGSCPSAMLVPRRPHRDVQGQWGWSICPSTVDCPLCGRGETDRHSCECRRCDHRRASCSPLAPTIRQVYRMRRCSYDLLCIPTPALTTVGSARSSFNFSGKSVARREGQERHSEVVTHYP